MLEDKVINFVSLILENCERISVDREHLNYFSINNVKENWRLFSPSDSNVEVETMTKDHTCDKVRLEIKKEANEAYNFHSFDKNNKILPFDRLRQYKDITGISIEYMDGTEDYVHVPWGGRDGNEDAEENDFQIINNFVDELNNASGLSVTIEAPIEWRSKY